MTQEQYEAENKRLKLQLLAATRQLDEISRMATKYGAPHGGSISERVKYLFNLLGW